MGGSEAGKSSPLSHFSSSIFSALALISELCPAKQTYQLASCTEAQEAVSGPGATAAGWVGSGDQAGGSDWQPFL